MADKSKKLLLWILVMGGLLIILAGVSIPMFNQSIDIGITPTPASNAQVKRVSVEVGKTALDDGTAVFIDVRDSGSYEKGHITGAINIPINELPNHLNELVPTSWIITYCT